MHRVINYLGCLVLYLQQLITQCSTSTRTSRLPRYGYIILSRGMATLFYPEVSLYYFIPRYRSTIFYPEVSLYYILPPGMALLFIFNLFIYHRIISCGGFSSPCGHGGGDRQRQQPAVAVACHCCQVPERLFRHFFTKIQLFGGKNPPINLKVKIRVKNKKN